MESQLAELVTIRRSLFDLEAQHERANTLYEDELKRVRSELVAVRQSGVTPVPLGIPGPSPRPLGASAPLLNTPAMSDPQSGSAILRHRERDMPEREVRDRPTKDATVERDLDRVADQRDAKRHKTRRDYSGSFPWPHSTVPKLTFSKKVLPTFLQGVPALMRSVTLLDCTVYPRTRLVVHHHHRTVPLLSIVPPPQLWLMNSNFSILHQNT